MAVSEIMLKMIPLILQRVEGFVLNFPSCPPRVHDLHEGARLKGEVRHPSKRFRFGIRIPLRSRLDLLVVKNIDRYLLIRFIQRNLIEVFESVKDAAVGLDLQ